MSTQAKTFLTEAEYLELERQTEDRNEYFGGEMFAMSRGTAWHAWIIGNIVAEVRQQLKRKPCRVSPSEVRLKTPAGLFTYPDVMVVCGDPQFADDRKDTLLNPVVIVEVLSPSTRDYDRGQKFQFYRSVPSLAEYVAVAQDTPHVELYTRQTDHRWLLTEFEDLGQSVELSSIGCVLPLSEVYDKIDWATAEAG